MGFVFQSHTWSHVWLPQCEPAELEKELIDSKKWIEDLIGSPVSQLCFPRGLFSKRIYEKALDAGYLQLVSSIPGSIKQSVMPNVLSRILVQDYSPREFVAVLNGAMNIFQKRYFDRQYQG